MQLVFATPIYMKITVFLHFSVGLAIEQTFDKVIPGLSEQNKLERMFVLYLYRYFVSYLLHYQFYL